MRSQAGPEPASVDARGWPQDGLGPRDQTARPVRGTQSFVYTMFWCWRHPSLLALEVWWRWSFGALALGLLWTYGRRVAAEVTGGTFDPARLGLDRLSITDPLGAASRLASALAVIGPACWPVVRWMVPLLVTVWIVVSALGRTAVLRRADPSLAARPYTLIALQALRVVVLGAGFLLWFRLMIWAGATAVTRPIDEGAEPNVLLYFVFVITGTLGLFVLWAIVSWWLAIAPLLAMLRNQGAWASLRSSFRVGALRLKLIEINLVMGIVKIALIVLAIVFSATPLPFESVATPEFLTGWWLGVTALYLLGSDFFHVARLVAYLRLWRSFEDGALAP